MENARETLQIVVVGHIDHGKSTVIGRLLHDTKSIPEGAIERVKRISREKGKPFEYAYLLDAFEEEQKQGITIDTTQLQFHTAKRDYVIIDAPGHKEFLKNMISGAANAEAALLIIDANEGIQEQSKRHGYILSLLGIQKVYVLVNKMDLIGYSEEQFKQIQYEMNRFLNSLNVYPLKYIPISAFYGDNMTEKSAKMLWYQGEPILEAIDLFVKDKGFENRELRFPIQDVYKFDSRRIIAGRIESGQLRVGDEILISPSNKVTRVKSVEHWVDKDGKEQVQAGMAIGITVEDEFFNKRGEFISHREGGPLVADLFKANLFWMGKKSLARNHKYKLKLATQEVECEIYSINKVIDATTLESLEDGNEVKTNDVAEVTIRTKEKICFDEFKDNPHTGRFVIVDGFDVSGGGIISGLEKLRRVVGKFVKDTWEIEANCFDEYYMIVPDGVIKKFTVNPRVYKIGDAVPIAGETYSYPQDFDVVDLPNKLVIKIRESRLNNLIRIEEYAYEPVAVLNQQGFSVKIRSQGDFLSVKNDFAELSIYDSSWQAAFANQWFDITKYRTIRFKQEPEINSAEYQI